MRRNAPAKAHTKEGERGAALATVLVMVSVMSMLAITIVESARFGIQRTANQEQMDQSRWYLLGAEAYATSRINQYLSQADRNTLGLSDWFGQTLTLPLDQGAMQISVWDGDNCFNLNSLAEQSEDGPLVASEAGQARLTHLLEMQGILNARPLAVTLSDWIDTDTTPGMGGAEDDAYGGTTATYLPPNRLIADPSELRFIRGFDRSVIARLSSLVCVRPAAGPNTVSINTLRIDQAALLSVMVGRDLTLSAAERIIRDRPPGGWTSVEQFLSHPNLAILPLSDATKALFVLAPRWYVISIGVSYRDASETNVALLDTATGHGRIVRRVFGADPRRSLL
ncbi:MAG TPA: type II secretion system minor pseudopilin GspK [Hyphomonadaceae bacterium]|nr:type II secretion system minor pseudopilin GspK [Hyphomonadaceae bacterium]HPN04307.1 type II secretion system minor pseudopilin GspK [Hyphomonadaceae bacterium]